MQKFIGSRLHLAIILFLGIIIAGSYSYLSVMDANSTDRSEQAAGSASAGVAVMDTGMIRALFVVAPGNGGDVFVARQNLTCTLNGGTMSNAPNEFALRAGAKISCKPEAAHSRKELK